MAKVLGRALFSSYSLQNFKTSSSDIPINVRPTYQLYGDDVAFAVKCINPEFRVVGTNNTVILDKKGKLFFEWVPRIPSSNRYAYDRPLRFALSPEEAALLFAKLKYGQAVELNRQQRNDMDDNSLVKVFRATPMPDGTVRMSCDYEKDGRGGQPPISEHETTGPLEINLMVGESITVQSILEYSIPRLTGWCTMLEHSIDQAMRGSNAPSPQNYGGLADSGRRNKNDVPF